MGYSPSSAFYILTEGSSRANDLTSPQYTLDEENETRPSRRVKTLKIRTEIRGIEKRKAMEIHQ